uniref:Cytochrome P450 n=1 Tax=Psilocybe cubensis TaxID=181762 RepID=A0A8H7XN92_PSICU
MSSVLTSAASFVGELPASFWYSIPPAIFIVFLFVRGGLRWQTLKNVRGPPQGGWLLGHQTEFYQQIDVGELDFAWHNAYGGAWKIDGCFGRNILMLSDPAAIHHTIHTMGYDYPKTTESKTFTGLAFGRGVSWAGGETHVRHRKLLAPAFTAQAQRPFYPVFRRVAGQLTSQWRDKLQEGDCSEFQTIEICRGLTNATLDIIGEAVFDYHFGSLDKLGEKNEFADCFHNLFADSNLFPPNAAILFAASWAYWPEFLLRKVEHLPFRQFIRFKEFLTIGKRLGKELIVNQAAAVDGKKRRDILSILVEANEATKKADRLSEDEVLSQVTTLLFAGHETTATTLTWIMYELARHPEDQERVREEIRTKRQKVTANGQKDFTSTDLESFTFTNACIKISPWITREARVDDVIPLHEPIIGVDGKVMNQVEVVAGQPVLVSTCAYNRHPAVWGPDSHEWNPRRHLNQEMKDKQIPVGVYSNLLTFAGGPSGCMGWRFALTEMQSTVVELVENFEFCPPLDKNAKMLRTPVGAIMAPMIEGKFDERTQMPLGVRPL